MNPKFSEFVNRLHEIHDLRKAASVLDWDRDVMMPAKGAATRADQLATRILAENSGISSEMLRMEGEIHELAGQPFAIGSPKQLGEILFDKLGLKGGRKGKSGDEAP